MLPRDKIYWPFIKIMLVIIVLALIFGIYYAMTHPVTVLANLLQLIFTLGTTFFVLLIFRYVFGFKRDRAGNPRIFGVFVPEWVMYLGYFAAASITLILSWYLLESISLYYAYELKSYLETQGFLYIIILIAAVILLVLSIVSVPKSKRK